MKEGENTLVDIMKEFNKDLNYINEDNRKPRPHITLGKVKENINKEILKREVDRLKDVKLGEMDVKQVKLKMSQLTKEGPVYTDYAIFYLKSNA